jgi:predicted Zn-dependent protease
MGMLQLFYRFCLIMTCGFFAAMPLSAHAFGLIRDAETEATLRAYATPIFEKAGLTPSSVRIFIVNSPEINAFVAGGANLFIHTGLILATDEPSMLLGVIAHETGHIEGGHLIQGMEKLKNAQLGTILSTVLGAAIMVGGGKDVGQAVIAGGQEVAKRDFLAFSRSNENAADQAGLRYLDALGISANGMLRLFEKLRQNEHRRFGKPDPYVLTHPLSTDRITHIRNHVLQSTIPKNKLPTNFQARYDRMIAKLRGFMQDPSLTFTQYPEKDASLAARYARSIAYFKKADLTTALKLIDGLIAEKPNDAYFHELRGQFLFENGKVKEAAASYQRAAQLQPGSALILANYGQTLLAQDTPETIAQSIRPLEKAVGIDPSLTMAWEQLVIAYGKQNNPGRSFLARAEVAALQGNPSEIKRNVLQAQKSLPKQGPARLRSEDLQRLAEEMDEDKKR